MCVLTAEADIDVLLEEKVAAIRKEVVLVTEDLYAKECTTLRKQIENLEDENALLKHQMTHLAEDLYAKEEAMRKRTESLEDKNTFLKNQMTHLGVDLYAKERTIMRKQIGSLEDENASLKNQMTHLAEDLYAKEEAMRKRTESLEDETALLKSQLMHLAAQQRHDNVSGVAFSVASHEDFGTEDSNIDYPVIYVNIGGGWHEQTHAFQAPVAGVYYFTTSCRSVYGSSDTYVNIVLTTGADQITVASLNTDGDPLTGGDANSVILQLAALDFVSVHLASGNLRGDSGAVFSTFSGFLLFQL